MMMSGGDPREELGGVVDDDTIAAVATAAGRSALAVVRVSGRDAFAVVGRVVRPWPLTPRRATLGAVHDPASGELLERPLVTAYPAPKSYTGEDVVELTTHGGVVAPAAVLAALIAAGAREALPGEFTRRAVLRGKLDLAQAEAIGDLIDARTQAMRRAALSQLDGGLSRRIQALRDALLHVEALVAYDVDFPGEDDGPIAPARVQAAAADALAQIDRLLATAPAGEIVRDGAVVVIAGPPNAGKSSLFNALLGEARAIVTDVPGTTRDAIEAVIESATPTLGGWPLRLVDTAGLRSADDLVERLGIEVSERWLRRAHVVLACGEWPADVATTAARVRTLTDAPIVGVRTKGDRAGGADAGGAHAGGAHAGGAHAGGAHAGEARAGEARGTTAGVEVGAGRGVAEGVGAPPERHDGAGREEVRHPLRAAGADAPPGEAEVVAPVVVSAERGDGLSELLARVGAVVAERYGAPSVDVPLLTRARHRRALEAARAELVSFLGAWTTGALPASIAAVHLHAAVEELATIIGAVDVEEVLGRVFGEFCVGK